MAKNKKKSKFGLMRTLEIELSPILHPIHGNSLLLLKKASLAKFRLISRHDSQKT